MLKERRRWRFGRIVPSIFEGKQGTPILVNNWTGVIESLHHIEDLGVPVIL